jgi:hypothetical protein
MTIEQIKRANEIIDEIRDLRHIGKNENGVVDDIFDKYAIENKTVMLTIFDECTKKWLRVTLFGEAFESFYKSVTSERHGFQDKIAALEKELAEL